MLFLIQKAICGTSGVSQGKFATGKKCREKGSTNPAPLQHLSPQGDFALSCLGQRRGTQTLQPTPGTQRGQIQSSGVSATQLCHSAGTKHACEKGLQFFTALASGKCINHKEKMMPGCISPHWANPGTCVGQIPRVPDKPMQLRSH